MSKFCLNLHHTIFLFSFEHEFFTGLIFDILKRRQESWIGADLCRETKQGYQLLVLQLNF